MHINFNINHFSQSVISGFKTISSQKIVLAITLIFSGCLAIYLAYQHQSSLKTKKMKLENKKSPIPTALLSLTRSLPKEKPPSPKEIPVIGQKEKQEESAVAGIKQATLITSGLQCLPTDGLIHLSSLLKRLDIEELSRVNKFFYKFINDKQNHPLILHSLLNQGIFLGSKKLKVAQLIGKALIELDLSGVIIKDEDLQELFQRCSNIKTLDLSDTPLTDKSLEYLSPNLTSLDLSRCKKLTAVGVKKLSRDLRILDLNINELWGNNKIINKVIKNLPPSLTTLCLLGYDPLNVSLNIENVHMEKLPQTLTSLLVESIPSSAIAKLSQNLRSLYLYNYDFTAVTKTDVVKIIENLPRNLTILSFCWKGSEINWTEEIIGKLPQQLTKLRLIGPHRLTAIHKLPQSLNALTLGHNRDLVTLKDLPRSLETLSLFDFDKLTDVENLPENLAELELRDCPILATIKQFSKNLNELELIDLPVLREINFFPENLFRIWLIGCATITQLNLVPQNLISFVFLSRCPQLTKISNLSKNLRGLGIEYCDSLEEIEDLINSCPPNLKSLILPQHWSSHFMQTLLKQLPSNLTYLEISKNHSQLLKDCHLDCRILLQP